MGAWGNGNFEQDGARDFVWTEVQQPLLRKIQSLVADPVLAQADESDSGPIVAAVEILALLCEQTGAAPPKPAEVKAWKDIFLNSWNSTAADIFRDAKDIEERRGMITATFDRLATSAARYHA